MPILAYSILLMCWVSLLPLLDDFLLQNHLMSSSKEILWQKCSRVRAKKFAQNLYELSNSELASVRGVMQATNKFKINFREIKEICKEGHMGGTFEVNSIRDHELLKKYAEFVRCDYVDRMNDYQVHILQGRRNRQLPCIVDSEGRPRICHILDNGVHVHQYGQGGTLAIIEVPKE